MDVLPWQKSDRFGNTLSVLPNAVTLAVRVGWFARVDKAQRRSLMEDELAVASLAPRPASHHRSGGKQGSLSGRLSTWA